MERLNLKEGIKFWLIPAVLFLLWYLKDIIFLVLTGLIFGLAVQDWAQFLKNKIKIPIPIAVSLIYLLVVLIFIFSLYALAPIIIGELKTLIPDLKDYLISLGFKNIDKYFGQLFNISTPEILFKTVSNFLNFVGGIFNLILILVISFYVASQHRLFYDIIERFFHDEKIKRVFNRIKRKFSLWLASQLFLMFSVGIATLILMLIFKIPYAGLISLIAGLTEIVPIIGPVVAASIAILITFSYNADLVLWVLLGFIIIQQLENNILVPLIGKFILNIPPLFTLVGILVGGKLGGILGIITVIPIIALSIAVYEEIR